MIAGAGPCPVVSTATAISPTGHVLAGGERVRAGGSGSQARVGQRAGCRWETCASTVSSPQLCSLGCQTTVSVINFTPLGVDSVLDAGGEGMQQL